MALIILVNRENFGIRLSGMNSSHEGRVELMVDGTFGTVCTNYFTASAAKVVCKMLGFE